MPFGKKPDGLGGTIDFDAVYEQLIAPAIVDAELEPLRADEEVTGGIIHKPMFERLMLCPYAVADLTTANANVYYELGVRHALRPYSTILVFAEGGRLPFDLSMNRALPYRLSRGGKPVDVEQGRETLRSHLVAARESSTDSPVYQLVDDFPPPDIERLKTDVFRDRARYSAQAKERLRAARTRGAEAVRAIHEELGPIEDVESGIVVDLFLAYRDIGRWEDMISLVKEMSA